MTLEKREDAYGNDSSVLTACPHCGVEFGEHYSPRHHLPCDDTPETEGFGDG